MNSKILLIGGKKGGIPRNGLIGEWLFSGNANDTSGYNNNGVVFGASLVNDRFDNPNSAYSFASIQSEYISTGLFLNNLEQFSVSFWSKKISNTDRLGIGQGGGLSARWKYSSLGDSNLYGVVGIGTGSVTNIETVWQHNIMLYNGSENINNDRIKIFVDGVQKTLTYTGVIPVKVPFDISDGVSFGRDYQSTNYAYHDGVLDDIRIYNRSLTESEINQLYNE